MSYFIYLITNAINGKVYVGYTNNVEKRWANHIKLARSSSAYKKQRLHHAIAKHGISSFRFDILESDIPTKALALQREVLQIAERCSYTDRTRGYNMTPGGEGGPTFTGRKHTDEFKLHMSEVQSNRSLEWQENFRRAQQNRSDEWRKNMSIAQKNRPAITDIARRRMSEAWIRRKARGCTISDDGKARIAAALKGRQGLQTTKDAVSDYRKLKLLQQDIDILEGRLVVAERPMRRHLLRMSTRFWETFRFRSEAAEATSMDLRLKLTRKKPDPE
mgnify:CR=1 FL=1